MCFLKDEGSQVGLLENTYIETPFVSTLEIPLRQSADRDDLVGIGFGRDDNIESGDRYHFVTTQFVIPRNSVGC